MSNKGYYSPPSKDFPQGLPDYWRFDNGNVRKDLKKLNTAQLNALGWTGPYTYPVPKDEKDPTKPFDFDPKTQKWVWVREELKFRIIDLDVDEIEYLESIRNPPPPPPPVPPTPNWVLFEKTILTNQSVLDLLKSTDIKNPLAVAAFPASFYMAKLGSYESFTLVWKELLKYVKPTSQVQQNTVNLANFCNLPKEFVDIISNYDED